MAITIDISSIAKSADGKRYSAYRAGNAPVGWKLPEGNFVSAKMSMTVVHPRPESNTWAAHLNAYPSVKYQVPIVIQGGAWPFKYEVLSGPSGMSIGENLIASGDTLVIDDDYGVLSWDNPTSGNHSVSLRVTDQDLNTVDINFTLVVGTSGWVFVDAVGGNDSTGDGTLASPYQSMDGWYGSSTSSTEHQNDRVYYRAGTYSCYSTVNAGNVDLSAGVKPVIHMAYPGEAVVWDQSVGNMNDLGEDSYIADITLQDHLTTAANWRSFATFAIVSRITFFRNTWDNHQPGTVGSDNPSCHFTSNNGANWRQYISYVRNTYNNIGGSSNGVSAFDHYYTEYTVAEHNTASNVSSRYLFWHKVANANATIRNNTMMSNMNSTGSPSAIISPNIPASGQVWTGKNNIEVCYNTVRNDSADNSRVYTVGFQTTTWTTANQSTFWGYRNSVFGSMGVDLNNTSTDSDFSKNVLISAGTNTDPDAKLPVGETSDNVIGADLDGTADATTGALLGTSRTTYLGTHGAEVSS